MTGRPTSWSAQIQREQPVHFSAQACEPQEGGFWSLTRFDHVFKATRDFETFSSEKRGIFAVDDIGMPLDFQRLQMISMDPPRHSRLKKIVGKAFTPGAVAHHEDAVRQIVTAVLDRVVDRERFDLVADVARPIPARVIGSLLGTAPEDDERLVHWTNVFTAFEDPEVRKQYSDTETVFGEIVEYCNAEMAKRRETPTDDLVSWMMNAEVEGEHLEDFEIATFFILLMAAGNDSTRATYSGIMKSLLEQPEIMRRLQADPSLIPAAIEEGLRHYPAFAFMARAATRDVDFEGVTIKEGERVLLWYLFSNRDETKFENPHAFDIDRPNRDEHQAFGARGRHFCLGAALARLELQDLDRGDPEAHARPRARRRAHARPGPVPQPVQLDPGPQWLTVRITAKNKESFMPRRPLRRIAAAAVLSLLVAAPAASAAGPIPQTDCFWQTRTTSMFDSRGESNYAFPDTGADLLGGEGHHARGLPDRPEGTLRPRPIPVDKQLQQVQQRADRRAQRRQHRTQPGLDQPLPARREPQRQAPRIHHHRRSTSRSRPPIAPPTPSTPGSSGQPDQLLLLRVYIPDSFKRAELTGGVGLPQLELHLADGSVQTGAQACTTLSAQGGPLSVTTLPKPLYESLRNKPYATPGFPAAAPPAWYAFYNSGFLIACGYQGACTGQPARTGGQYSNIDNQYVSTFVNRSAFGGPLLVLKGKLPATVRTGPKVKRMGRGQLRYWSICQNESLYTTKGAGCLFDRQIPVDRKGRYTIVSSLPADRPANARTKCGVGFLPWPANGDGDGHLDDGFLIVRNMLPAKSFTQAVQNTKTPGDEAAVMGPYLPKGSYTTKAAFAKRGC